MLLLNNLFRNTNETENENEMCNIETKTNYIVLNSAAAGEETEQYIMEDHLHQKTGIEVS